MEIVTLRLGSKAQVVIPKKARQAIGLSQGKKATLIVEEGHGILLGDPQAYGGKLRGLGKEVWATVGGAKKYLRQERRSWRRRG